MGALGGLARGLAGWRKVAFIGALVGALVLLDETTFWDGGCERKDMHAISVSVP